MARYDSDSAEAWSEEFSSQSHRRLHRPSSGQVLPVHSQGMYRADGLVTSDLETGGSSQHTLGRSSVSNCRELPGMYDPDQHVTSTKEPRSMDSLSRTSQPEYLQRIVSRPASGTGTGPYAWTESSSASQDLYLHGDRSSFRRSFCGICFTISIVLVIAAVISVAAISAYLGFETADDSIASKYEMTYQGEFKVAQGDFFRSSLRNKTSQDFLLKADQYGRMLEQVYSSSYLSEAFRRVRVDRFEDEPLRVMFVLHLDRRRVPTSVLNTEKAVSDIITQEVMSVQPQAFRDLLIDIDSIKVTRGNENNQPDLYQDTVEELQSSPLPSSEDDDDDAEHTTSTSVDNNNNGISPAKHEERNQTDTLSLIEDKQLSLSEPRPASESSEDDIFSSASLFNTFSALNPAPIQKRILDTGSFESARDDSHFKLAQHVRGMLRPEPLGEVSSDSSPVAQKDTEPVSSIANDEVPASTNITNLSDNDKTEKVVHALEDSFRVEAKNDFKVLDKNDSNTFPNTQIDDALTATFNRMLDTSVSQQPAQQTTSTDTDHITHENSEEYHVVSPDLGAFLAAGVPQTVQDWSQVYQNDKSDQQNDFIEIDVGSNYGPTSHETIEAYPRELEQFPFGSSDADFIKSVEVAGYDLAPWNPILPLQDSHKRNYNLDDSSVTAENDKNFVMAAGTKQEPSTLSPHIVYADGALENQNFEALDKNTELAENIEEISNSWPASDNNDDTIDGIQEESAYRDGASPSNGGPNNGFSSKILSFEERLPAQYQRVKLNRNPIIKPKPQSGLVVAGQKLIELLGAFIGNRQTQRSRSSVESEPTSTSTEKWNAIVLSTRTTESAVATTTKSTTPTTTTTATTPIMQSTTSTAEPLRTLPPIRSYSGVRSTLRSKPSSKAPVQIGIAENSTIAEIGPNSTEPDEVSGPINNSSANSQQFRSLIRLMSLKYPGLMANSTSEGIREYFNSTQQYRRLIHSLEPEDNSTSRMRGAHQRGNTKFLELEKLPLNNSKGTPDIVETSKSKSRSKRSETSGWPQINKSLLDILAKVTRSEVSDEESNKPNTVINKLELTAFPTDFKRTSAGQGQIPDFTKASKSYRGSKENLERIKIRNNINNESIQNTDGELIDSAKVIEIDPITNWVESEYPEREQQAAASVLNRVQVMMNELRMQQSNLPVTTHESLQTMVTDPIQAPKSSIRDSDIMRDNEGHQFEPVEDLLHKQRDIDGRWRIHRVNGDDLMSAAIFPSLSFKQKTSETSSSTSTSSSAPNKSGGCGVDSFKCPGHGNRCLTKSQVCDGTNDCPSGADELHCLTLSKDGSTDNESNILESREGLLLVRKSGHWSIFCAHEVDTNVKSTNEKIQKQNYVKLANVVCKKLSYPGVEDVSMVQVSEQLKSLMNKRPADDKSAGGACSRGIRIACMEHQCGARPKRLHRDARIVGGASTRPGEWPWQAALYKNGQYKCGATLISEHWLISAAHCYVHTSPDQWTVRLGAHRRGHNVSSINEQQLPLSHIVMHPHYREIGFINDIALLRTRQPALLTRFVRPACLPQADSVIEDGRKCTVIGWGQLQEVEQRFPDILQEVDLPLISTRRCRRIAPALPLYRVTKNMFCAGFERGGRDACLGDSGGPLLCESRDGHWELTGVTSNGYGCARVGRPGVYTNVAQYRQWIDQTLSTSPPPVTALSR